jgi:lysophospholipase L1-like esterase
MNRAGARAWVVALAVLGLLLACSSKVPPLPRLSATDVVLAFGDSLTFGTGAAEEQSYPVVLAELTRLNVVRAGVPGEITSQGLARLPTLLAEHKPKLVLLCLGGNDMLRKLDDKTIERNLRDMVNMARAQGAAVILLGVPRPALFGGAAKLYGEIAKDMKLVYEGDIINSVLRDAALKADPIHPNAAGYRKIAERLAAVLKQAGAY